MDTVESFELIPAQGDPKVGKKVFDLVSEVISDKVAQGLHEKWQDLYRLSRNNPWKKEVKNVPLLSANLLHTHRQRTVNTLTDNAPTFNLARVGASAESSDMVFEGLQRTCEHWWRETEQQESYATSVNMGEMNGCAIEKVIFDPDLEYGIGEVRTVNVDPYHFGVYPVNVKKSQDAEANLHFYPMSVREAKRKWPKFADQIKADAEIIKELGETRRVIGSKYNNDASVFQKVYASVTSLFSGGQKDAVEDQTLIVECWVKDFTSKSTITEENGQQMEISEPAYPGGIRRITCCSAGNVVLEDIGNPNIHPNMPTEQAKQTYLFDKFPFTMVQSVEDVCSIWGSSDWEQLDALQREFAKTLSQYSYFKDKAVRPKIINPEDSGVDNAEFTNSVGIIRPATTMQAAGIKYFETSNNGVMRELEGALGLLKDLFFLVSGTFEMEKAQTGQVTAYKAIAALMEHASTMMRGKIRAYQKLIRERGRMYLSHVQNFYTEERWISFENDGKTQTQPIVGTQMIVPTKLTVVSGSTLPKARMQMREEAVDLAARGMIDQAELLRVLEWPNRAEVIERMKAGPLGTVIERLQALGMSPQMLQVVMGVSQMDDKQFKQAAQNGELPSLAMPQQQQQDPKYIREQADAGKALAERDLAVERVVSERVEQQVKMSGIAFDQEMLGLERAKVMNDIDAKIKSGSFTNNRPGYNESGMQSNNR